MYTIHGHLKQLIEALQNNQAIKINRSGEWDILSSVFQKLQHRLGFGERREIALAQAFQQALDRLEAIPVRLSTTPPAPAQEVDFALYLQAGLLILEALSAFRSFPAQRQKHALQRRLVALQYRLEASNGGLSVSASPSNLYDALQALASHWKESQKLLLEGALNAEDEGMLREVTYLPAFADLLIEDKELRESFFVWTLRDQLPINPFIQFPALQEKIVASKLSGRLARAGGMMLRVQKWKLSDTLLEKVVTLPFEGREVSLLNDKQTVTLKGDYTITIQEFFNTFANKHLDIGELELFGEGGVTNWNCHKLGYWNAKSEEHELIDLTQPNWWKQLPMMELLSLEGVQKRYGHKLDGTNWNLAACATRSYLTLNPDESHAFLEVAAPIGEGRYAIYSFGKFATKYATNLLETAVAFTDNLDATIAYPDENIFFSHRQLMRFNFSVSGGQGIAFMHTVRDDMVNSRHGNFIYQWESENCAKWIQDKLEHLLGAEVPNLFRMPMLLTEPAGPSRHLFAALRQLPHDYQGKVLGWLHYPLGAWRGRWMERAGRRFWQSITTTRFWVHKEVYLPALLHRQYLDANTVPETTQEGS